jgi:6-phosphogluconolactonase (cycloisomerase 2 family)
MKLKTICVPMGLGMMRGVVLVIAFTAASFAQSVKLSVTSLTFAAQLIGTTSVTRSTTLTNTDSTTPLAISNISDSGDYSETDTCGTNLAPSSSCTIFVTFSPTVAGTISGAVTINDNASNSLQVVSLSGTGVTPVTLSPATLPFGTVPVGTKSASKIVTITNNQSASVTFTFSASGNYSAVAGGTTPCGTTLAAHSNCTLAVTFQPTVNGSISGALTVTHNAPFSPQGVGLSGSGSGGSSAPLTFSPTSLSFGSVVVSSTSAGKVVTVKNVSAGAVNITGFPASGSYASTGSGAKPCGGSLNAGQSCTFTVTFTPSLAGTIAGAVTVADSAADSPQVLGLTGSGIQLVTLTPSSLTFAAQQLGTTSAAQTVTLTNHQAADTLTIDSITPSGDFRVVPTGRTPCAERVPAMGSCTIGVVFAPAADGSISGALTVAYNASSTPGVVNLSASATGLLPRHAYTANGDGTISSYTVDSTTGQLKSTGYALAGTSPNAVATTPSGAFVYAANRGSANVSAFSANAGSGALTAVSGSPFPGEPDAFAITVAPSGKFVYVTNANSTSNNISAYAINSTTGALTQISGSPFQAGNDTRAVAIDPTGKFLYAANATSNDVSAYTINPATGSLTQIMGSPFPLPSGNPVPQSIAVDPATKFVFVGSSAGGGISAFTINATNGALTGVTGSPFPNPGGSNYGIAVDSSDRFVYVANDSSGSVSAYTITSGTGALNLVFGSPFSAGTGAISVAVDPSSRFVYLPDLGSNSVFMFTIDSSSGALTLSRTIHGRMTPLSIALANGTAPVTYTPKFAYAANSDANNLSAYTIDAGTGVLTPVPGSPFKTDAPSASGPQPVALAVNISGTFEYAADFNGSGTTGYVSGYSIDPLSGALTFVSSSPFAVGNQTRSAAVDSSGRFVYIANPFSNNIYGFRIDPATGNLAALSLSPFTDEAGPWSLAVDPSGRFLCVTSINANQLNSFSIDPVSGNLTTIGGAPPTGTSPELVEVDPSGRFAYVASLDGHVSAYTISATGSLTQVAGSPFLAGADTISVAVDPSGRFVYAANRGNGSFASFNVSAYTVDPNTGALTEIAGSPFPAGFEPISVAVDPSGNFVYVANEGDNDVSAYTIDQASGALIANPAGPFAAGANVYAVTTTAHIH